MNTQTTAAVTLALLLVHSSTVAADDVSRGSEVVFVQEGNIRSVREIGAKWTCKEGALVCGGTGNFLVAGKAVGAGDFLIRARLSLEQLDGTAASLVIGGNHFGFDGRGEKLFVEGPALGRTRLLGDAGKVITPGKPFDLDVTRKDTTLSFRIDGKEVHTAKYTLAPVCAIGFRPWRATMRLYDFSASGDMTPVTEAAINTMQEDFKKANRPGTKGVDAVTVGGVKIDLVSPPEGLALRRDLGILAAAPIQGKIIHRSDYVWVPRATITPEGDYLILFPEGRGRHYQGEKMLAYRSSDKGKTWSGPTVAFDSSQSHHGFVPLVPRGSKRIYAFGTQPIPGMVGDRSKGLQENCPIGFRHSDDDGLTWSDVTLIRPENDPEFTGMSCVRMCATDAGTWLIGSHDGIWAASKKAPVRTRQYILRSEDQGKTWQLLPKKRPGGWYLEKYDRMDEGTLVNLGGGKVLLAIRTAEGHIWASRSEDDGRTWSDPKPTTLVHPDAPPMVFHLGDGKTLISFIHNRYDPGRPHFDKAARNELWCSISKDEGRVWSEPRFVFAGATKPGHIHSCSYVDMFADDSRIHIVLGQDGRQLLYLHFDESDLPGFLTKAELAAAVPNPLAKTIQVGGVTFDPTSPPKPLVIRRDLGLVTAPVVDGRLVHQSKKNLFETRATITPGGDYLLMFPEGAHYGGKKGKVNTMIAYRSFDKGKTWTGPKVAFDIDYSQHGFIPLIPRGSKRIYAFGTQPIEEKREGRENCPIGFRWSDNDGHTWSDVTLIRPENNPDFLGMSVMRMCETDAGTWLLGSHEGRWKRTPKGPVITRAYVLRSEDQGKTWTVHPEPRPGGWFLEKYDRMDEPRPIHLGGGKVLVLARTCDGRLWEVRSNDDGRTWTDPKPTELIHPDAPPMLFHHPDGKTLVAFHHNRHSGSHFKMGDRNEIWVSLSADQGRTWSEPRFAFANALAATSKSSWNDYQCSYLDAFADGEDLHLFVPHRWKRALHLRLNASDLDKLPTKAQLLRRVVSVHDTSAKPLLHYSQYEAGKAAQYAGLPKPVADYRKVVRNTDVETYSRAALALRKWMIENDPHRPIYHFTGPESWINDPNGPIYHEGKYHLFYQFDPMVSDGHGGWRRSARCWGHAVSDDLVHWGDWPVALWPDTPHDRAGVFSGNTVIDRQGFPCALYTGNVAGHRETYGMLARSTDGWLTWQKTMVMNSTQRPNADSPVHWDGQVWREGERWCQLIGGTTGGGGRQGAAWLWTSNDLKHWTLQKNIAAWIKLGNFWELPYLIRLGGKHVLLVGRGNPYWVGTYDANAMRFTPDDPEPKSIDNGTYYSFNVNMTDDKGAGGARRQLMHGWVTGPASPTKTLPYWQGAHSIPRVLSLCGPHVVQQPIPEIEVLRGQHRRREAVVVKPGKPGKGGYLPDIRGDALEIVAAFDRAASTAVRFGLMLRVSADGKEYVRVWYDPKTDQFGMDGAVTKKASAWARVMRDDSASQPVTLRIFLDRSILEVYCGGAALTGRTFCDPKALGVDLFAEGGRARLVSLDAWEMESMWGD